MRCREEIEIGETYAAPSCTITETDVVRFAALTEDFMGFHVDKEFAKTTVYAGRVAHGLLDLPCMERLKTQPLSYVASMAPNGWTIGFRARLCMGDAVSCHFHGAEDRKRGKSDRGIFILAVQLLSRGDEVFRREEHARMIKRQPPFPLPARHPQLRDDGIPVRPMDIIYSTATLMGTRWRPRSRSAVSDAPRGCTRSPPVPGVRGRRRSVHLPGSQRRAAGCPRGALPSDWPWAVRYPITHAGFKRNRKRRCSHERERATGHGTGLSAR